MCLEALARIWLPLRRIAKIARNCQRIQIKSKNQWDIERNRWCMYEFCEKKQPQRLREFGCPDIKDEDVRDVADRCRVGSEGPGGRKRIF
jgi:hypothetical protein